MMLRYSAPFLRSPLDPGWTSTQPTLTTHYLIRPGHLNRPRCQPK